MHAGAPIQIIVLVRFTMIIPNHNNLKHAFIQYYFDEYAIIPANENNLFPLKYIHKVGSGMYQKER